MGIASVTGAAGGVSDSRDVAVKATLTGKVLKTAKAMRGMDNAKAYKTCVDTAFGVASN